MTFVHPNLRDFLTASAKQPRLADTPVEIARAANEARARSGLPGPEIEAVDNYWVDLPTHKVPVRIYRPEKPLGVTVAFHGGAWIVGSIETFDQTCRYTAKDSQTAVVSVGYRLSPENPFPSAIEDGWGVIEWLMVNGAILNLPVDKMMFLGESAGGNIAAVLALMARDAKLLNVRYQVLIYPPLDPRMKSPAIDRFSEGYFLNRSDIAHMYGNYGVGTQVTADDWRVCPLRAESFNDLCPALIISASADPLVDEATEYAQILTEASVETTHVVYRGMCHLFFGMRDTLQSAVFAQKQVATALNLAASR